MAEKYPVEQSGRVYTATKEPLCLPLLVNSCCSLCITTVTYCCFSFVDVNECADNPCPLLSECTNTNGGYNCECANGYKMVTDEEDDSQSCEGAVKQ